MPSEDEVYFADNTISLDAVYRDADFSDVPHAFVEDPLTESETAQALQRLAPGLFLPRDTLTATGGWCAPSETVYDLGHVDRIDWNEIGWTTAPRGGLRYGESRFVDPE